MRQASLTEWRVARIVLVLKSLLIVPSIAPVILTTEERKQMTGGKSLAVFLGEYSKLSA
jgi:hypothetical protein